MRLLATCADLHVAPGTFVRAEQSHVVHADETGWGIGRLNARLWVFSSKVATIDVIRTFVGARGHQVPEDILGPDFDGYLVADGLKSCAEVAFSMRPFVVKSSQSKPVRRNPAHAVCRRGTGPAGA